MIELTEQPIDLTQVLASLSDPQCGAQVLFVGTTRQWTVREDGQGDRTSVETDHLLYESYREMATKQLQELEQQARQRWPVRQVTIVHRLGTVLPEETSVAVAVSCPHRSEAFEAARWLIDTIKHEVPIWKQEHYVQHGDQWIHPTSGSCRCTPPQEVTVAHEPTAEPVLTDGPVDPVVVGTHSPQRETPPK